MDCACLEAELTTHLQHPVDQDAAHALVNAVLLAQEVGGKLGEVLEGTEDDEIVRANSFFLCGRDLHNQLLRNATLGHTDSMWFILSKNKLYKFQTNETRTPR